MQHTRNVGELEGVLPVPLLVTAQAHDTPDALSEEVQQIDVGQRAPLGSRLLRLSQRVLHIRVALGDQRDEEVDDDEEDEDHVEEEHQRAQKAAHHHLAERELPFNL